MGSWYFVVVMVTEDPLQFIKTNDRLVGTCNGNFNAVCHGIHKTKHYHVYPGPHCITHIGTECYPIRSMWIRRWIMVTHPFTPPHCPRWIKTRNCTQINAACSKTGTREVPPCAVIELHAE